jgi:AcrR family transcriptional regulator
VRKAVLAAALAALRENGVERFTIADVAQRAGVHETSIYRRWGTPEKLVLEALLDQSEQLLPVPDTGELRADLITFLTELAGALTEPAGRALLHTLAAPSTDPTVIESRAAFWQCRYDLVRVMLDRAIERGELSASVDQRLLLEALIGPLHFRTLLTGEPIKPGYPDALVDTLLGGVGTQPGP